jgi:RNA polymerase sigma factor (sigma-70 family)
LVKTTWVLTQEAFDALLARLDPDTDRAGQKYEQIRRLLITFFECRSGTFPDDLADDTINRVARQLLDGREIYTPNPASYFFGVARNVLKEHWDASARMATPLDGVPLPTPISEDPERVRERESERDDGERRFDCLERCLQALAARERDLIRQYYDGEAAVKIAGRKSLAQRLGIPINALRIRALRVREKLEGCVGQCLQPPMEA